MNTAQHTNTSLRESVSSLSPAAAVNGRNALPVQDNRPAALLQKKQLAGMNRQAASIPLQKKANNTGLPDELKSGVEQLSGISMNDVKVHYNSNKPATVQAHAYAQGTDIHIAPGQEKHLPHEAWHVVQQKQGRVKPTKQLKSRVNINDDKGLEQEADVMGARALQRVAVTGDTALNSPLPLPNTLQRAGETAKETAPSSTPFVVSDEATPSEHQVRKTEFLASLESEIRKVADSVLERVHQTSENCPYIPYWFNHYQEATPEHLLRAIGKYAPAAALAKSWQEIIQAVTGQVYTAFSKHISTGTLDGVPADVPKDLLEKETDKASGETAQLRSDIMQFCKDCFGSSNNQYVELENLPAWGDAVRVGFHATTNWAAIKSSGEFRPGGGALGDGIYVGDRMAKMYAGLGTGKTLLEVGYIGSQDGWQRRTINKVGEYSPDWEGQYDVIEVTGVMAQSCFKNNGPGNINFANFRVRPYTGD